MARRNIAIQASVFRPRLSQRSAKVNVYSDSGKSGSTTILPPDMFRLWKVSLNV